MDGRDVQRVADTKRCTPVAHRAGTGGADYRRRDGRPGTPAEEEPYKPPVLTFVQSQYRVLAAKKGHCTVDELVKWWRDTFTGYAPGKYDYADALHASGLSNQITPASLRWLV